MRLPFITTFMTFIVGLAFSQSDPTKSWTITYDGVGIYSSPRIADLNGDGIGDVIFGAGRVEFHACDSAVVALDGATGKLLWNVRSIDHLFTSPMLMDITGDQIPDVFMAGRSAQFAAINGKTGEVIWNFDQSQGDGVKWFNFYNPQFVKDQDGDGTDDLLISNGGNVMILPNVTKGRYPGNLIVVSGKTGKLLAKAQMPDGKETYMSVAALPINSGKDYKVIFGSGGETIGGHLYATTLSQIMKGDLSKAKILDASHKGYIAPPVWIDINNDGHPDVVANAVEGKLLAFDGITFKKLWSVKMPNTEAYSSIAPGFFTGNDQVPDFFVTYAVGEWPDLGWSQQFMINGATGKIAFTDSLGSYQTSTPVVIDLNGDGIDEAIMNLNVLVYDQFENQTFQNMLVIIDFKSNDVLQRWDGYPGSNLTSTPWIGDMDKDGLLDIVYCQGTNVKKTYSFDGIRISRIATDIPIQSEIKWGSYMGSNYDGVFQSKKPQQK